jgi:hypothetical protein
MTVGQLGHPGYEYDVQPVGAKLHDCIACCSLRHVDLDMGMLFPVSPDQLCEEASRGQGMDTDAQAAAFP